MSNHKSQLVAPRTPASRILSALTIASVGLACKAFLNLGLCSSVRVNGLEILKEVLENEDEASTGRGLITGKHFLTFCKLWF